MNNLEYKCNIITIKHTFKSFEAPDVILSGPNIISSAARPPIIVSIKANILDFVMWYSSFAGIYAVYKQIDKYITMELF